MSLTSTESLFLGAGMVGVLASCWSYIKAAMWRVVNLMVVKIQVENGYAGLAVLHYCWTTLKRSPWGEKRYGGFDVFVQPVNRNQVVGCEKLGHDFVVFWRGWLPLIAWVETSQSGNLNSSASIMFIRGTFDADDLLIKAIDAWNAKQQKGEKATTGKGRFSVNRLFGRMFVRGGKQNDLFGNKAYNTQDPPGAVKEELLADCRYLKWSVNELGTSPGDGDPFDILAFPAEVTILVERVRRWLTSESWYREKQIPWRMGLLLYGIPGCGKSSLVRAVGQQFDLPVNVFDLSTFGNEEFVREWGRVLSNSPCIMLVEDIDTVFDGRVNRLGDGEGGLTFDCLLNCLSGVKESSGVLVIITTNRPELLDDALGKPDPSRGGNVSTRPGRIDYAIELGPLDVDCRRKVAERILSDCPHHIEWLVRAGDGDSGAQFQNRCEQVALGEYWNTLEDVKTAESCVIPVESHQLAECKP